MNIDSIYRAPTANSITIFNGEIESYLLKAKNEARNILGKKSHTATTTRKEINFFACYLSVGTLAFIGKNIEDLIHTNKLLDENKAFIQAFSQIEEKNNPHVKAIQNIVDNYTRLLTYRRNNNWIDIALTIAAVTGIILLSTGIGISSVVCVLTGTVLASAGLGGGIAKLVFRFFIENPTIKTAQNIYEEWKALKYS